MRLLLNCYCQISLDSLIDLRMFINFSRFELLSCIL
uniref:Uncharacterized protein n=1 Tax=Anguilla anguilla TaxID=7936 RepID=A0A0E9STQ4_ANGAN